MSDRHHFHSESSSARSSKEDPSFREAASSTVGPLPGPSSVAAGDEEDGGPHEDGAPPRVPPPLKDWGAKRSYLRNSAYFDAIQQLEPEISTTRAAEAWVETPRTRSRRPVPCKCAFYSARAGVLPRREASRGHTHNMARTSLPAASASARALWLSRARSVCAHSAGALCSPLGGQYA